MRIQLPISNSKKLLLWWIPSIAYTSVILLTAFVAVNWRLPGRQTDKLVHMLLYGVLSCLLYLPLSRRGQRAPFLKTLTLCLAISILDESIQIFNPARIASLGDLFADLAGSFSGTTLCTILLHKSVVA